MLRGERRAYRRGTATGHLSTRHDLTSFLLFPRRLPSSETRRPNRRSKLAGGGEKGGGSLFLFANHKRKRSISCQVTRDSSKQESIWFPRTEIHTFPIESIRGFERSKESFQPPRLAISKKAAAARVGGKHASLARFAKRWRITQITTAFPLLRIREEGEGGGSASTGLATTST